jgi:diaminopimelate epimerase
VTAVPFTKYHGHGNDFAVVDLRPGGGSAPAIEPAIAERVQRPDTVRAVCARRFGVGADGVLALLPGSGDAHARMRVLNADGSEAEMCGNGLRCVVKHLYERDEALRQIADERGALIIDTGAGPLSCTMTTDGGEVTSVTVNMGAPRLARGEIPMIGPAAERCIETPVPLTDAASLSADADLAITAVSMGNPHAIAFVDHTGAALRRLAETVGPRVETHAWFPNRTNAEFARMDGDRAIELVVWERGCGITLACGTGACATAVAACITGHARTGTEIEVRLLGGPLAITVADDYGAVFMRGPATRVYDAELTI